MKLEKLLCLKYLGRRVVENLYESQTMKLLRALLHETSESVAGSSTISKVFVRNGGGPTSCRPSNGWGAKPGEEDDDDDEPIVHETTGSSSLTITPSMASCFCVSSAKMVKWRRFLRVESWEWEVEFEEWRRERVYDFKDREAKLLEWVRFFGCQVLNFVRILLCCVATGPRNHTKSFWKVPDILRWKNITKINNK